MQKTKAAPLTQPILVVLFESNESENTAMHALSVLKTACYEALEDGDKALYYSVVDPTSVLELIETVEVFPAADEMEAISSLLDQLTDFVKRSPSSPERDDLVLLSRQIRGVVGI
jgi:hypothetical protein